MSKTKYQSGFAHIIILTVILALGLIGALGYIYWQNFIQNKSSNSKVVDNSQTDKNKDSKIAPKPEEKNTLIITEWGVKGVYSGNHPVSYSIALNASNFTVTNTDVASFSSSDVTGICAQTGFGAIARATRDTVMGVDPQHQTTALKYYTENPNGDLIKKVGSYYFVFVTPHQGCATSENDNDPNVQINTQIESDLHNYMLTLESI